MRAAGNNPYYTFVMRDDNTGRYLKDSTIKLYSSSTIVKQTLAAPQLVPWAYRTTRDVIVSLAGMVEDGTLDVVDFIETFSDEADAEEWLKENKLRPDDQRDERADQGTAEHKTLERLAVTALHDEEEAYELAGKLILSDNLFEVAIGDWWLERNPVVVAAELRLPCPRYGYCGTTDLVYLDTDGSGEYAKAVTDLKTRRAGLGAYTSDRFQVDSYLTAYNELNPAAPATKGTVLVARDDGTWDEVDINLQPGAFLKLKAVWDECQRLGALEKGEQ